MIHRLLKKQPDGSYKVVGYQKQERGRIYHKKCLSLKELEEYKDISDILHIRDYTELKNFIPHNRIDRYTGIEVGGVKLFERNKVKIGWHYDADYECKEYEGIIKYSNEFLGFYVEGIDAERDTSAALDNIDKIIGIEGVSDER